MNRIVDMPNQLKVPPSLVGAGVALVLLLVFGIGLFTTGLTTVQPGEVAFIINNVTGTGEVKLTNGTVIHLPFGMTRVYKLDKTTQPVQMTAKTSRGARAGDDSVQIKTTDGSNVNMDVEVQYQIIPEEAEAIVKRIGRGDSYKDKSIVRAYSRSIIRDELGKLSVTEIADSSLRDSKLGEAKRLLNEHLMPYGIRIILITATNPSFNPQYEKMIKDRKEADQEVRNQKSAQQTVLQEQAQRIAKAERIKETTVRNAEGKMRAKIIEADEKAKQTIERSKGNAYAITKEGEQTLVAAKNQAQAIEYEGLARAEAIRKLADAYAKGGINLVREALSKKYRGVVLEGRPYSLSSNVDRLQLEKAAASQKGGK